MDALSNHLFLIPHFITGGNMLIVNKKLPSLSELKRIVDEYQKSTNFPTPTGLLNKLGITYSQWEVLLKTPTPQTHFIEAYFQHIAEQIEKLMIYQNDRYKNYKAYEFMLKKLCPFIYGDKKITKEDKEQAKQKELIALLDNKSGIKLA